MFQSHESEGTTVNKIEKQIGNIRVVFNPDNASKIPPFDFAATLPSEISRLRVEGATTDEAMAAERFYVANYIKLLLEEFEG